MSEETNVDERPRWWLWNIYGDWVETRTPNPYAQVHLTPGGDNHGVVFGTTANRDVKRAKLLAAALDAESGAWVWRKENADT